jgi:hypothetical protein
VKGAHLGANTGRVELLLGPDLTASERSDAGGNAGKNIAPLVLAEVLAARQRSPTKVAVSNFIRAKAVQSNYVQNRVFPDLLREF